MNGDTIQVGGAVTSATVVDDASAPRAWLLDDATRSALQIAADEAVAAAQQHVAYGRTTGVGANRNQSADDADGGHGLRLVRSHATGAGRDLGPEVARASMLIRAHQLAQPGSGIPPAVVDALVDAANADRTFVVREFGGMGTGDITSLAELALCLLGERPWRDGERAAYLRSLDASGALSFMSSSAPTLAVAAMGATGLSRLLHESIVVAGLSAAAVRGNPQQWSSVAAGTRPSDGVGCVAEVLRSVAGTDGTPARTQDPLSFRCIPFVAGPALDVAGELSTEVDRCIAAQAENPRFADGAVWHHGAFMLTSLGLRLDAARLGLVQWASTSLARLVKLHDPQYTGGMNFLADGPSGSSGTMVLEYTAGSALETVRQLADPSSRHTTTISIGTEDHASFATRGALALREMVDAGRVVIACELLAAVRTLRLLPQDELTPHARRALAACADLPSGREDRPHVDDVAAAVRALPLLSDVRTDS
ncbi:MAG: aromatic amino acid lyase [Ilumatobacteraceae bacterium]